MFFNHWSMFLPTLNPFSALYFKRDKKLQIQYKEKERKNYKYTLRLNVNVIYVYAEWILLTEQVLMQKELRARATGKTMLQWLMNMVDQVVQMV